MITNETRAVLIQPGEYRIHDGCFEEVYCDGHWEAGSAPEYDTDANAVAELRAFVRARGRERVFVWSLWKLVGGFDEMPPPSPAPAEVFALLDATPAQQCAAFDAVFADDLEKL